MSSDRHERSKRVKEVARGEGFDACGIATAGPIDPENICVICGSGRAFLLQFAVCSNRLRRTGAL